MRKGVSGPSKTPPPATAVEKHDHEWGEISGPNPILEDGAAIFREECQWVEITGSATSERLDETFYETGAECDATRSYRMEAASVTKKRDNEPNIEFLVGGNYDAAPALIAAETQGEIIECDYEKSGGSVRVETDDWIVKYEAGYDS